MKHKKPLAKVILNFLINNTLTSKVIFQVKKTGLINTAFLSRQFLIFLIIFPLGLSAYSQSYEIDDNNGLTISTCSGNFYDSNFSSGLYNDLENYTVTFCSNNGNALKFSFSSFWIENLDTLYVYDGPNISSPIFKKYTGFLTPFSINSSGTCFTFVFKSNDSFTRPGWAAAISCCPPPITSPIIPSIPKLCAGSTVNYSVDNHAGSTYNWTVLNGTPASIIGGVNNLNVTWNISGNVTGFIKVVEVNSCGSKDSSQLIVDIDKLPTVNFSGLNAYYCIYSAPATLTGFPAGGSFSGPGVTGNAFNPATAGAGTHSIVYFYTDPFTGCSNQKTILTTVDVPSIFSVGASATSYCTGSGVSITLSGSTVGVNYQLRVGGIDNGPAVPGTGSPLTWTNKTQGVYTVVATSTASSCNNTMSGSQTITENPLPVPAFSAQPGVAACSANNVIYTTPAGQSSYIWGFTGVTGTDYLITSGGGSTDNSVTLRWLTAGSKIVTINYTNSNGCTATAPTSSTPTTVTVNPPAPAGSAIQNLCSETSPTVADLSAAGSGIRWYNASSGGILLLVTTPLTDGTHYYASQTVNSCESTTRLDVTASISSIPLPPATNPGSGATCSQITANWTASARATSYRLDVSTLNTFSSYVSGYQDLNVGNVTTYNVNGLTAGVTYYYRIRAVNYCGTSPNSTTIIYATLPATPAVPGPVSGTTPQCPGLTGQIYSIGSVLNATTYTWTVPAGWTITSGQGTTSITVNTGAAGQNGNISVTAGNSCGTSAPSILAVTVSQNAAITSVTGLSPLCIGGTSVYTANGVILGGGTGAWSSSNPAVASVSAAGLVTGISAGTCNIIYTITGGCGGTVSAQQSVTINPNAAITSVTGLSPLCIGGTSVYTASGVLLSGGTGAWSSSNPAIATVSATGSVTGISTGTCNIIYTITGGCGSTVSAQQSVTINPNAAITSVTGLSPLCIGGTSVYTSNGVVLSGGTGAWSSSNPVVATVSAAGLVTGISAGTCNIIYTITGGCGGTVSAQRSVTINPNAAITSVTGLSPLCISGTSVYNANGVVLGGGTGAWSSSNPAVATVSAAGSVTGISTGTCNIIYTITGGCGGTVSAQSSVTINTNAAITSVTGLSPLCIGGTSVYTANGVVLGGGTGAWSSSNPAVATVSAAGSVTGISAGTCNIIYTITGGCGGTISAQQSLTISPNAAITSVTGLSPLCIGGTSVYTANGVVLGGGTGAWSSSNPLVATVSAAGSVTGISSGTCNIIYTITGGCGGTVSAQRSVTINPNAAITSVTGLSPLCIGGTSVYTANGVVLGGGTGAWSSSNPAVATVSAAGLVTGISSGTCNILYTISGGCGGPVSALQSVTINPNAAITSVTGLSPLCIGGTSVYTANGVVLSGGTGAWSSSNPTVATVSAAGLVTGISAGTCNIIYTITGGCGGTVSAQRSVTINPNAAITSVTGLNTLCIGGTSVYTANGVVLGGGIGAWSSSNPLVATVSAGGLVTGISIGTCNIIYTITGGCGGVVTAQQSVTINQNPVITSVTGLSPLCIGGTSVYTANGVVLGGGTGAWSSSNPAVATVSVAGSVTGISSGTCNIIYTITGGCGGIVSAQQSVTINPNAAITSVTGLSPLCIGGTSVYTANSVVLGGGIGAWSSSNPLVATVSAAGLVTGISAGPCNIIYTITGGCGGTVSAQQSVTINPNAAITSVTGLSPLCIGGTSVYTSNGVVLSGGTGSWSSSNPLVASVSAAGLVTGISAGTCNIIYTITGGCGGTVSAQQSVTINQNAAIASMTSTSPLCIGGTSIYTVNGVILSGGIGVWSSSNPAVAIVDATGLVTGIAVGSCNIIYTITGGCGGTVSTQQSLVISPNVAVASVTGSSPMCIGGSTIYTANGVVLSGGTGAWSSSNPAIASVDATGLVTGLSVGTCDIIYTISGGCGGSASAFGSITITGVPAGTISYTGTPWCSNSGIQNVTLSGTLGGTFSASPAGLSIDPVTGVIDPGTSLQGTYTVTYSISVVGCGVVNTTTSVTINQAPTVIITDPAQVCSPATVDLTASAVTAGSTSGLTFTYWTDATATIVLGTPAMVTTGVYYIKGTDGLGCSDIKPVNATVNPLPSITGTQTDLLCFGANTGAIDITVTGGSVPYTFAWTGTGVVSTSEDQANLTAGLYSVVVTDANICNSPSFPVTLTEPTALTGSISSQTNVSVFGGNDGSVTVVGSGGTPPYLYKIGSGTYQVSGIFGTLSAASYIVTVQDFNLCSFDVPVNITQPLPPLTGSIVSQTNVLCYGTSTASITVQGSGGLAPYEYSLNGGVFQVSGTFGTLASGNYIISIRDAVLNTFDVTATITQPSAAVGGSITSQTNILCFGNNTGSVTVSGTGGVSPYQYKLSTGSYQVSGTFSPLAAGVYTVTVQDANLCTYDLLVTMIQPAVKLTGSIISQQNVTCSGSVNGSVSVAGAGGTSPYEYRLNGGAFQVSSAFSGLARGNYSIDVRDANLCTVTVPVAISEPAVLSIAPNKTDASCPGVNDGSITLAITGGTQPYTVIWSDGVMTATRTNITDGTYSAVVTDINGCAASMDVVVGVVGTERCLEVQGIITPNNDGFNDTWKIKNIDLFPNAEVFVFNRWGQLVFNTKNISANPWDGTLNGKLLPTDSYHYTLHLNDGSEPRSGVVSIIR